MKRLIGIREVKYMTGLSKSTILRWMQAGEFPRSFSLGVNCVRWYEHEVIAWIKVMAKNRPKSS